MRISDWSSDVCSSDLHVHWQLRTADSGSRRGRRRTQAQRQCRALGQPQLRGPYPSANADELPGLADAGRGLRTGRDDACQLARSEEHTSELQSLMRISYAVFCLKKKKNKKLRH